jgi:predicted ArsR family transcriptional regulator
MSNMLEALGQRQQQLLHCLLDNPDGLTVDELTHSLGITHTAVRQHLTGLERDDFVARGSVRPTGRRPEQAFVLSTRGRELFPRRYNWLGDLLVESLRGSEGSTALTQRMRELGTRVGQQMRDTTTADKPAATIAALAEAMQTIGYESGTEPGSDKTLPDITAHNCVFHHLAAKYPEVCHFDLAMMAAATGTEVQHAECMVRGGQVCRFHFRKPG